MGQNEVKLGSILDQIRVKTGSILDHIRVKTGFKGQDGVNLGSIQIGGFNSLLNN